MSFWADCVKFVRSEIFRSEVVEGHTPFRFERIEVVVPPNERFGAYALERRAAHCIVSLSISKGTESPENAVAFFSYGINSVYVAHREPVDRPMKYQVDIMYILDWEG